MKNIGGDLSSEESRGCYVAYYLKHALGEENVLSVNQVNFPPTKINSPGFFLLNLFPVSWPFATILKRSTA